MYANAETWWDSKECRTTQRKRKNYNDRKTKKTQKYSLTLILMNFCSTDNDSDDSDGERSDSNIDYAHRLNIRFFLKDFLFSHAFIAHTK